MSSDGLLIYRYNTELYLSLYIRRLHILSALSIHSIIRMFIIRAAYDKVTKWKWKFLVSLSGLYIDSVEGLKFFIWLVFVGIFVS